MAMLLLRFNFQELYGSGEVVIRTAIDAYGQFLTGALRVRGSGDQDSHRRIWTVLDRLTFCKESREKRGLSMASSCSFSPFLR
ncbi:unnamed protein product [Victoria cruziana]